jgi:hypothetical protein
MSASFAAFLCLTLFATSALAQERSGERSREPEAADEAPPTGERRRPREAPPPYESGIDRAATGQQANSIRILVRYKKAYGYKAESSMFGGPAPTSCQAFAVDVTTELPVGSDAPIGLERDEQMSDVGDAYVCRYTVIQVPLNQRITIRAGLMPDESPTDAWLGGGEAQPPSGWRREIAAPSTQTARLSAEEPRASLEFEMVYAPSGDFVAPRPKPDGIFRQQ